jgi:hypothetical protein
MTFSVFSLRLYKPPPHNTQCPVTERVVTVRVRGNMDPDFVAEHSDICRAADKRDICGWPKKHVIFSTNSCFRT